MGVATERNIGKVQIVGTIDIGVNPIHDGGYVVLVAGVGLEEDKRSWELLSTINEAPVCFKWTLRPMRFDKRAQNTLIKQKYSNFA